MRKVGPTFPLYWIATDRRPSGEPSHMMEVDHAYRDGELVHYCRYYSPPWQPAILSRIGHTAFTTPEAALEAFRSDLILGIQHVPRRIAESQSQIDKSLLRLQQAEAEVDVFLTSLGLTREPEGLAESALQNQLKKWRAEAILESIVSELGLKKTLASQADSTVEVRHPTPHILTLYACEQTWGGQPFIVEHQYEYHDDKLWYLDATGARGFHFVGTLKRGLRHLRFSPASAVDSRADHAREFHHERLESRRRLEAELKEMKADLVRCEQGVDAFPRVVERFPTGPKQGPRAVRIPKRTRTPRKK